MMHWLIDFSVKSFYYSLHLFAMPQQPVLDQLFLLLVNTSHLCHYHSAYALSSESCLTDSSEDMKSLSALLAWLLPLLLKNCKVLLAQHLLSRERTYVNNRLIIIQMMHILCLLCLLLELTALVKYCPFSFLACYLFQI